jgi:thymidine phosphorylase
MAITTYTSYAQVRAVLGVSDKELSDATLALEMYDLGLKADLQDIGDNLVTEFAALSTPTGDALKFQEAVKLFATYAVAQQLASSLPLFAPKMITDGKAGVTRDANSPYKQATIECRANYQKYRTLLEARYAVFLGASTAITPPPLFTAVTAATDEVTGV